MLPFRERFMGSLGKQRLAEERASTIYTAKAEKAGCMGCEADTLFGMFGDALIEV